MSRGASKHEPPVARSQVDGEPPAKPIEQVLELDPVHPPDALPHEDVHTSTVAFAGRRVTRPDLAEPGTVRTRGRTARGIALQSPPWHR
jgi:hypothetical protein